VGDSAAEVIRRKFAAVTPVYRLAGHYVGRDGQRALVDVGDGRIPVDFCGYLPSLNEPVWVELQADTAILLGSTRYLPDRGTLVTVSAGLARVLTDAPAPLDDIRATYNLGEALSSGQIVKLYWSDGPHIVGIMSTQPTLPPIPDAPASGGGEVEQIFTAIDSGSYRSRWWTNDVWYAENNKPGAWFYGTKIKDTIPDNATVLSVDIWLRVTQASGSSPQIGTHGYAHKPGGGFGINNKVTLSGVGAGFAGWVGSRDEDNKDAWRGFGEFLKQNDGGVGTDGAGLRVFAGINADGQSGALRIRWRT